MQKPLKQYWHLKLSSVKENLENNNFEVFLAESPEEAKDIALNNILPKLNIKSLSWGGSMSFVGTGLFHALMKRDDLEILNTFNRKLSHEDLMELRRKSLLVDLYITGSNAVTEAGQLVNLDMVGNRVAAMIWGPRNVLLIIGRNKICTDIEEAMTRIKNFAAPVNALNLDYKTPCKVTGICHDCDSPERICNYWTITEKSFVKNRIKIILVNDDLGF